jgi:hypothetical protein
VDIDMMGCLMSHFSSQDQDISQTAENTQRTLKHSNREKPKRLITSLHHNMTSGTPESRFNNESLIV